MKDNIFATLQKLGQAMQLPIAILPIAGLLLGIGAAFTNTSNLEALKLVSIMGEGTVINSFLKVLTAAGSSIFGNLHIIFAIALSLAFAKGENATAGLGALIFFIIMHSTISMMIQLGWNSQSMIDAAYVLKDPSLSQSLNNLKGIEYFNKLNDIVSSQMAATGQAKVLGIQTLEMGVFGGIVAGAMNAFVHNRSYEKELPEFLAFFSGKKFALIMAVLVGILTGMVMFFIWPVIQSGIKALSTGIANLGVFGSFLYAYIERILVPFGLHHVFYIPFWQTDLGGTAVVAGKTVTGAQNIIFAEMADPKWNKLFSIDFARFMSYKFPFMMFGLPGAALAMYHKAKSSKQKMVGGLLLSAAITSFLTGITEPLEFTFLFIAPVLFFGVHAVLAGLSAVATHLLNVAVPLTFSGGAIDFTLFGIMQGISKTNWHLVLVIGPIFFIIYYLLFRFIIQKWDLKTPGREDDDKETKLYSKEDFKNVQNNKDTKEGLGEQILIALGGSKNIKTITNCATKLRLQVKDPSIIDEDSLKSTGALGVIKQGNGVQVVYGPQVETITTKVKKAMGV